MEPRRSERLKEKNMSSNEENAVADSPAESDDEKTMIEMDEPSVAELKEEIVALKNSLQKLLDASKPSISSALITTETQMPFVTPPVVANNLYSTSNTANMPASTTPMHQQKVNIREYTMPFQYNLPQPFTAARSFVPTIPSLPYSSAQPFAQTSMPYCTIQSNDQTPYTVAQRYTTTTTTTNIPSFSTSVDNLQQRFTQMYTSAPSQQQTYPPVTSTNLPTYTSATPVNMADIQSANDSRQLRKLHDLPPFSGQPEQWPMFIVAYKETTTNYNYSNLENLIRLQKSLKGDARAKVESFLIHPDTVNQVVSTLEFHYGRPQLLIRSQIAKVRAIPSISERKMYDIVNFSTMVSNLSAFLLNANATAHLSNPTLLDELVNKLPLQKREEWTKHSVNHLGPYPSVHEFSLWLQEAATYISLSLEDPCKSDVIYNKKEKTNPSFTILTEDNRHTKCPMCHQNHLLYNCDKFKRIPTNERWQFVKNNHLCFGCLRPGHNSFNCKNRRPCGLLKCAKYHNRLLHEDVKLKENDNNTVDRESSNTIECQHINTVQREDDNKINEVKINREVMNDPVNALAGNLMDRGTLFKYLPVKLTGPKGSTEVVAFIDEGSKITLLEDEVADKIGLHGTPNNLCLGWIGGKTSNEMSRKVNFEICGVKENNLTFQMRNVFTTKNLNLPPQNLQIEKFRRKFPIFNDIVIEDYYDARPKLLIGLPHTNLVRPSKVLNLDGCFALHQTSLGNIIFGSNEDSTEATVCKIDVDILNNIHKQVLDYFTLENLGIKLLEPVVSHDDIRAVEILKGTTLKKESYYETGLLWKRDIFETKDSYPMALKRLQGMEAKMNRDECLAQWYMTKINDYVAKSYARKLSSEEAATKNSRTWYLPHFVVTNVNKENKRRLVFDAAACVDGESFNTRLMKGPEKYQPKSLLSILFRFRQGKIGVCADIREMFHRVRIREEDQTAQRFLWRDGQSDRPPDVYVMQVMIFGSISSPCSAQYVKNLNAEIYKDDHPKAYKTIVDNHYVDDYVDSFDDVNEAISVTRDVVGIHRQAGFELRGFVSNSTDVLAALNNNDCENRDQILTNLCDNETTTGKILGMRWRQSDDSFCFVLEFKRVPKEVLNGDRKPTKSEVLSLTMSIFDPYGFLSNIIIKSKILLQELWRSKIGWDSPIPDEIYAKWYIWYRSLYDVCEVKISRCYGRNFLRTDAEVELHIFADASQVAYAAVAYWRLCYNGDVEVIFVAGKSRCAPLKPLSIPRLELQAALLGVRLKDSVISSHDIKPMSVIFWTDSKTVMKWIQSDCRAYKQFVAHRIAEILDSSELEQWRWVPGTLNPADEATRPQNFSKAYSTSSWLNGPAFLSDPKTSWPKLPEDIDKHECQAERRSKFIFTVNTESIIPFERFSHFNKLVRVICWVRRAVKMFKSYGAVRKDVAVKFGLQLNAKEINDTTEFLCKMVQRDVFSEEYNQLIMNKPLSKSSSIFKLTPFLSKDGLIRLSGRIYNATYVVRSTQEPIILPKKHILTTLIVKQYHEKFRHQNHESICAAIRIKFWIPCLRQLVRSAKRNCQICKNMFAVPKTPLMGQHPEDRLTPYVRAFSYTGIDYIGPFFVSIGRRREKRWVSLFTCLTTRAIHLEIAKDLSTDAVILCIRNFVNRRGLPVRIRSDRGTNFVGASKEKFIFDDAKLIDECSQRGIEWVFNTPANPSAGGAWERMVRSVKNVLAFTLKEKTPQVETFNSLLIEAENLINSRPLTHLPIECTEAEPLTPNHFLIGCPNIVQTPAVPEKTCLRKQWQILQQLKQSFWKRWIQEYLPELTRRTKWHQPVKPIQTGDVVIICDDNETRGQWKRGVVEEVFLAADGQVRSAVVRTIIGKLRRPASKLAVLDVRSESPWSTHGGRDVVN